MSSPRSLADLTTLSVGGAPERLVEPASEADLIEAYRSIADEPHLILGGGSNLLVSDEPFDGTVLRVVTTGVERLDAPVGRARLRVAAGEGWDALVARTLEDGLSGLEALSGIPGSVGASPVQNIGAYGQELADVLVAVDFTDEATGVTERMPAEALGLGYRTSVVKQGRRGLVSAVELELAVDELSAPVGYAQLADALGVAIGDRVPAADVRRAVLALRGSKGMVLDPEDADSVSAGSFFTNPIVPAAFAETLPAEAPRWPQQPDEADLVAELDAADASSSTSVEELAEEAARRARRIAGAEATVKLSAAWLIGHAGIPRGFALPGSRAAVSSKHTLALTNRGGASAEEIAELARYVRARVQAETGVLLIPEPVLVGVEL